MKSERPIIVMKSQARSWKPVLQWVSKEAPHKWERETALRLLRKIADIHGEHKQILVDKNEETVINAIYSAFPTIEEMEPKQLKLL